MKIKIETIDYTSPHLANVIALGDANTATLGFLPEKAFHDYAARKHIIVAVTPEEQCVGYVMYRIVNQEVRLVHLCIHEQWRSQGIAKKLVSHLSQTHRDLYGIGLWCRRDYEITQMWPKLGFVSKGDKPGRSADGKLLTLWWLDHDHPNLFSVNDDTKLHVVIDANVFFDLHSDDDNESEESKSLLSDWLQPYLQLCLTPEILNEIDRNHDKQHREKQRQWASQFTFLPYHQDSFDITVQSLRKFFPEIMSHSDQSDLRQIARTIASKENFFVTRDTRILGIADEVYEQFRITILRPTDLILQIDELLRKPEYQPVRLAGTHIEKKRVNWGQEILLTDTFLYSHQSETKAEFQRRLRRFLSNTESCECFVITEKEKKPLALIVYSRNKPDELEISMLRVTDSSLSATLARHLILSSVYLSASEQRRFTRITELYLDKSIINALKEDTFIPVDNGWLRINLAVADTAVNVSKFLTSIVNVNEKENNLLNDVITILNKKEAIRDSQSMSQIERLLWPAKIVDADIPTFIIPIQPMWAQELFDEYLANQTLFGIQKHELALSREGVYYRANAASKLKYPGRILWYVSYDRKNKYNYIGTGAIRACSRLEEVIVGKPKDLFRQFRRLGVYDWNNIFDIANKDINNNIQAIRFCDTELFRKPIQFDNIQKLLGQKASFLSPRFISSEKFAKIYIQGNYKQVY